MIQAPIFHVNGDDPEAVVRVGELAFAYRQTFKKDVVIDMVCYRKRGHNETDNPSFTQPLMYDIIEAKRSTRKVYTEAQIARGDITMEEAARRIGQRFGVVVSFVNPVVKDCRVTATFYQEDDLDEIMTVICGVSQSNFVIQEDKIVIDGKGCN